jgi:quercetin dioxygenase-like cupin family protein/peroxiredoxin
MAPPRTYPWMTLALLVLSGAPLATSASDAVVARLMARDLVGMPGKEVTLETVEYPPGGKSPPHRHDAQVFVYVLEGSLRMQVKGAPVVTLGAGATFYESPDDVHVVSENASQTKPAKFLVVMVKSKEAAASAADESGQGRAQSAGRSLIGSPAPALVLTGIDGESIDLPKLYGHKPVYLKFWATWCVPCREQMPGFEHDYETLGDRIAFVAVNAGFTDTEAAVRQVQRDSGLRMPIVIDDGRLAAELNLRVTPQHIVIGRDGRILYVGHLADERLHEAMKAALAEPAGPAAAGHVITTQAVFGVGDTPHGLTATTSAGEAFPITGSSPDARPRVLVFFSPWCESYLEKSRPASSQECKRVREEMNQLAPHGDAHWLGIASGLWASPKDLADYQKDAGTEVPLTLDTSGRLFRAFGVRDVPTVVLLDAQGKVAAKLGPRDRGLEAALRTLEAKKAASSQAAVTGLRALK